MMKEPAMEPATVMVEEPTLDQPSATLNNPNAPVGPSGLASEADKAADETSKAEGGKKEEGEKKEGGEKKEEGEEGEELEDLVTIFSDIPTVLPLLFCAILVNQGTSSRKSFWPASMYVAWIAVAEGRPCLSWLILIGVGQLVGLWSDRHVPRVLHTGVRARQGACRTCDTELDCPTSPFLPVLNPPWMPDGRRQCQPTYRPVHLWRAHSSRLSRSLVFLAQQGRPE